MTAWRTSPNRQPGFPRQGRLHRSAPRWLLFVPVTIAAVLVLLGGLIVTFNQRTSALPEDQGLAEQILGVLAGASGRVATLTGRTGASVRFVYDPIRKRGALVVVRLPNLGEDLVYRLWLIDASGPRTVAIFSPVSRRGLLGSADPWVRRPRRPAADRRPGAGRPRRQPHRTGVHGRPFR